MQQRYGSRKTHTKCIREQLIDSICLFVCLYSARFITCSFPCINGILYAFCNLKCCNLILQCGQVNSFHIFLDQPIFLRSLHLVFRSYHFQFIRHRLNSFRILKKFFFTCAIQPLKWNLSWRKDPSIFDRWFASCIFWLCFRLKVCLFVYIVHNGIGSNIVPIGLNMNIYLDSVMSKSNLHSSNSCFINIFELFTIWWFTAIKARKIIYQHKVGEF